MGAVANLRPDLFAAMIAEVPFVDIVTTMLDPELPLTVTEWEEWGAPRDPAAYARMKAYERTNTPNGPEKARTLPIDFGRSSTSRNATGSWKT